MKKMFRWFWIWGLLFGLIQGPIFSGPSAETLLVQSDALMRGKTSQGELTMLMKTPRWERKVRMQMWSQGNEKSFIKVLYPPRDRGITFLKLNQELWQYIPRVERRIKIPPSMMLQSWMGSDFTNDDLVRASSIVEDYSSKMLSETNSLYQIELIPKPESAVVWGKVIYWMDKKTKVPVKEEFYDEEGVLVNILEFTDVKQLNDRPFPMQWKMIPQTADKKGHLTVIKVDQMVFNQEIPNQLFSLQSLKKMSQ